MTEISESTTMPILHPWLSTPEALLAARKAVQVPMGLMPYIAERVGFSELYSEALVILTECALEPRERECSMCAKCGKTLEHVRKGAKFCSPRCKNLQGQHVLRGKADAAPRGTLAHIGSMWSWPESERASYAKRQVGYCLLNYVRTWKLTESLPPLAA